MATYTKRTEQLDPERFQAALAETVGEALDESRAEAAETVCAEVLDTLLDYCAGEDSRKEAIEQGQGWQWNLLPTRRLRGGLDRMPLDHLATETGLPKATVTRAVDDVIAVARHDPSVVPFYVKGGRIAMAINPDGLIPNLRRLMVLEAVCRAAFGGVPAESIRTALAERQPGAVDDIGSCIQPACDAASRWHDTKPPKKDKVRAFVSAHLADFRFSLWTRGRSRRAVGADALHELDTLYA